MQTPAQGIALDLLRHVHCISTYRYPVLQTIHQHKVAEYLLEAPKIAANRAPFYWTYLDRPADGMIIQTWQPEAQLGNTFASDGYVWIGPENGFVVTIEGVGELQVYQQNVGYAPGEPVATHARRRYRLISRNPNASANPDLWIIHYYQADPQHHIRSNAIAPDVQTQQIMQTRAYLQSQGQITVKEFMLHDRSKWPHIAFPGRGPAKAPPYFNPMQPRTPQQMAYPTQQMISGPAAKRVRTHSNQPHGTPQAAAPVEVIDDEEDTSRGDMFDHMTPREVAQSRYVQNQEWLEEVFSPIPTQNIVPVDLGLGLGGSLKQVTNGIFETYSSTKHAADPSKEYVGHLDSGKAEEFRKRANEKIEADTKAIERMKRKHARQMAKLQKNAALVNAEKALRTAVNDPANIGAEYWRLEGKLSTNDDEDEEAEKIAKETATAKVDDIVAALETSLGLHTAAVKELKRIQDGGFLESAPQPPPEVYGTLASTSNTLAGHGQLSRRGSNHSSLLAGDHDLDMGTAASLLDQYHTGFSAATTPGNGYTPQHIPGLSAPSSNAASPMASYDAQAQGHAQQSQPQQFQQQQHQPQQNQPQHRQQQLQQQQGADVEMGGTQHANDQSLKTDTGDWVVIPPGGVSPPVTQHAPIQSTPAAKPAPILPPGYGPGSVARQHTPISVPRPTAPQFANQQPAPAVSTLKPAPILPPGVSALQSQSATPMRSQVNSPAAAAPSPNVPSPAPQAQDTNASTPQFNNNEPVDFSGLDDLDTAGFEEGMDLVDDSAFGEAFHGVEPRGNDGEHEGDGL